MIVSRFIDTSIYNKRKDTSFIETFSIITFAMLIALFFNFVDVMEYQNQSK